MKETIDLLFRLQQLDDEIDTLRGEEESIPVEKRDLEEEIKAAEEEVKQARKESVDLAKLRKDKELELEIIGGKITKFQSQVFQVKSNREYEALQHEISALKEQSSSLEDEILEILERGEGTSKAIVDQENALEAKNEEARKEEAKLDQKLKEISEAIMLKNDERRRLVARLDPVLLKRYEKIRDVKGGMAVAVVKDGACGGCFRRIPPQEMQILKKSERIIACEGCGRIIIWRGDST